jgi:type VI secretion system secreted protein VgrG
MFEDAKGRELVHVQAQRDYTEVVKRDQASTVMGSRTASVAGVDATVVGGSRTVDVDGNQSTAVGGNRYLDVGVDRITVVGGSDILDVEKEHRITVASGTGIKIVDKEIHLTTGDATVILSKDELSLNAKGNLWITAGGSLSLSGTDVFVDGGPMVRINCHHNADARWSTLPAAQAPRRPGRPRRGGRTSRPAVKLSGHGKVEAPGGFDDVKLKKNALPLHRVVGNLPARILAAPSHIDLSSEATSAIHDALGQAGVPDKLVLVRDDVSQAMRVYRLAPGESLASLPSTLQVFGPVLPPVPSFGLLAARDLGDLVNVGNTAGVFHVASSGGVAQLLALRTAAAPESVDGAAVQTAAQGFVDAGTAPEKAYAQGLAQHGIALYHGDAEGIFSQILP